MRCCRKWSCLPSFICLPLRRQRVTKIELSISTQRVNQLRNWDLRWENTGFLPFLCFFFLNKRLQLPLGNNFTHTHTHMMTRRYTHSFGQFPPENGVQRDRVKLWKEAVAVPLTPTPRSVNRGSSVTLRADKRPLPDSALCASVHHTDTTEVEFCYIFLTSFVFQRQPPGGKLGKQPIHPVFCPQTDSLGIKITTADTVQGAGIAKLPSWVCLLKRFTVNFFSPFSFDQTPRSWTQWGRAVSSKQCDSGLNAWLTWTGVRGLCFCVSVCMCDRNIKPA